MLTASLEISTQLNSNLLEMAARKPNIKITVIKIKLK